MPVAENYLENTRKLFHFYKSLGEKTIAQLNDEQLLTAPGPDSNSIAVVVKHMRGNMLSRFTNFLTTDGEKEWRQRDDEFEHSLETKEAILEAWEEGWSVVFAAIDPLSSDQMDQTVFIRNLSHTVLEALQRQLCHYAYHVGQIVYWGKQLKGEDWKSLSIPKGKSAEFNADKFSKENRKGHFTDDYLDNAKK